jgi:cytochrome c oxidase assembly protein subunit 11
MKKSHQKTIYLCLTAVFMMFALSFMLIPLYNSLCRATGIGGRVDLRVAAANAETADHSRQISMQFVATNNARLPWDFYPKQTSIDIHPGEDNHVLFYVKNNTDHTMTVQAIPSITPWQAAKHLHKVECFCFTRQTLKAGESLEMPVVFRIDNALPVQIKTITLAYTLFDVTERSDSAS